MTPLGRYLRGLSGGLPAAYWWLWGGMLVSALATFVFPFLTLFLTSRGFGVERAGLVVAAFGGGTILSGPAAGHLADRLGRRPTMVGSLVAGATLTALLGVLTSPAAIAITAAALGLVSNAFRPAAQAAVADLVPTGDRARAFGLLYWANNLGLAFSFAAGGSLAAFGYGKLFLADALTTLLFAAIVWRRVPETLPALGRAEGAAAAKDAPGYGAVLADRDFMAFLALNLVFLLVFLQFMVALPVEMARHGHSAAVYGRVLAVNGLLIALLQPSLSKLVGRLDSGRVLATSAVLVGVGYGSYALCADAWPYAAATAVWTLGEIVGVPVASAVVADLAPADRRGRYQGAFGLSWGLGMLLSPMAGSAVLQRLGPGFLWGGSLALALLVAAGQIGLAGPRRRRLAARAAAGAGYSPR